MVKGIYKRSEEWRKNQSVRMLGNKNVAKREDVREKISSSNKIALKRFYENHPEAREKCKLRMLGNEPTEKTRRKISKVLIKQHKSGLRKRAYRNISKAKKGVKIWENKEHPRGMLGKNHTDKTKRIISKKNSINQTGNKNSMYGKKRTKESLIRGVQTKRNKGNIYPTKRTKEKIGYSNKIIQNKPAYKLLSIERRAKQIFPVKDTKIEVRIQNFLKKLGIEYFTHQYLREIEHSYQCDILIPSMNLVIECDGNYWHKYPVGKDIDHIRTKELIEKGFKVLRLWECEIIPMSLDKFKERLENAK